MLKEFLLNIYVCGWEKGMAFTRCYAKNFIIDTEKFQAFMNIESSGVM